MNTLWAILMDVSGSMSEGFSGKGEGIGVTEAGPYITKLDAAKDHVIKKLTGITKGDIAVISFNHEAHVVCQGQAPEVTNFTTAINSLEAGGGTSIANAILFALKNLPQKNSYKFINFVVISDGLADFEESVEAANECEQSSYPIRIDAILIDPNEESIHVARGIAEPSGGDVSSATTSLKLREALDDNAETFSENIKRIEAYEKREEIRIQEEARLQKFITGMAAIVALAVTLTGILSGMVEKPSVVIPLLIAGLTMIGGSYLVFIALTKEQSANQFYRGPRESDLGLPKPVYKYSKRLRLLVLFGAVVCLGLTIALCVFTYSRSLLISNASTQVYATPAITVTSTSAPAAP